MTQVIIFTNENGNVTVGSATGEMSIQEIQSAHVPQGVQSYIVDSSDLPNDDHDFFNAWEQTDGVVTVNLGKAKEITKTRLRFEREPLLAAQDVAYMKALETGADTTAIVAEKQRLRDITLLADTCTTTEELRNLKVA